MLYATATRSIAGLLALRCQNAESRFTSSRPEINSAIQYNDRLAAHWRPGIQTCDHILDEAECGMFRETCLSLLTAPPPAGRPARRMLVIDLGGGTGKVLHWMARIPATRADRRTYLYFDISPRMREAAGSLLERLREGRDGTRHPESILALADVTHPVFSFADWDMLRREFHPIVAVCAGGTIGNFGGLDDAESVAQDRVFRLWLKTADASVVTFLDPERIGRSLKAYAGFGRESGMYDGQRIRLFDGEDTPLAQDVVPFAPALFPAASRRVVRRAALLRASAFWAKLDMLKEGQSVGQVTRHYSEAYARARFLGDARITGRVAASRATCMVLRNDAGSGH